MALPDYYKILGLPFGASEQDVKAAHRRLSKKFHPDLNNGEKIFEEKFKEVQGAYDVLSNRLRRSVYLRQFAEQSNGHSYRTTYTYNRPETGQHADKTTYTSYNPPAEPPGEYALRRGVYFVVLIINCFIVYRSCLSDDDDSTRETQYAYPQYSVPPDNQPDRTAGYYAPAPGDAHNSGVEDGVNIDMDAAPIAHDSLENMLISKAGNSATYDTSSRVEIERWILGKFRKHCKGKVIPRNSPAYEHDSIYGQAKSYSFDFHGDAFRVRYVDQMDTTRLVSIPVYNISIIVGVYHVLMFGQWYRATTELNVNTNKTTEPTVFTIYFELKQRGTVDNQINMAFRHLKKFYKAPTNETYPSY